MSADEILSPDEITALMSGVDSGDVEVESDDPVPEDQVAIYEFTTDRIVRGQMPTLEMIYERFTRLFYVSLFSLLRRSPVVSAGPVQMLKFSEYVNSLTPPAHMNLARAAPLKGNALFVFDAKLIFTLVDNFFGGKGTVSAPGEARDFTPTELRVAKRVLGLVFGDMQKAWTPITQLEFEHVKSEVNPHFASIVSPSDMVVVTVFHVELDGGSGDLHVVIPYSMLEPLREQLVTGVKSEHGEGEVSWARSLYDFIGVAPVTLSSTLTETQLTLGRVLQMKPGDIIPIELTESVVARVESVPVFRGKLGVSRGNLALQVVEISRDFGNPDPGDHSGDRNLLAAKESING